MSVFCLLSAISITFYIMDLETHYVWFWRLLFLDRGMLLLLLKTKQQCLLKSSIMHNLHKLCHASVLPSVLTWLDLSPADVTHVHTLTQAYTHKRLLIFHE